MNRPIIQQNGLTYVWQTNAHPGDLVKEGNGIRYHLGGGSSRLYPGAIEGRPAGNEDYTQQEQLRMRHGRYATIAENERDSSVGIYVPQPPA